MANLQCAYVVVGDRGEPTKMANNPDLLGWRMNGHFTDDNKSTLYLRMPGKGIVWPALVLLVCTVNRVALSGE